VPNSIHRNILPSTKLLFSPLCLKWFSLVVSSNLTIILKPVRISNDHCHLKTWHFVRFWNCNLFYKAGPFCVKFFQKFSIIKRCSLARFFVRSRFPITQNKMADHLNTGVHLVAFLWIRQINFWYSDSHCIPYLYTRVKLFSHSKTNLLFFVEFKMGKIAKSCLETCHNQSCFNIVHIFESGS
jgi:hypothetical protein